MTTNVLRKPRHTEEIDSRGRTDPDPSSSPGFSSALRTRRTPWQQGGKVARETAITSQAAAPLVRSAVAPRPVSQIEQYWAARALTAEALLSARLDHHQELKSLMRTEDLKRSRQLSELQRTHELRQRKLEYIIIAAVFCITVLASTMVYLLSSSREKPAASWGLASHFTVPILSPFTSVVEQETSVIGAKTIIVSIIVLAGLAYITLKDWLIRR